MEKQGETNTKSKVKPADIAAGYGVLRESPLRVVYSNDLNQLADQLGEELFSSLSQPFENRLVVVPNVSVKDFLFHRFVANPLLKMAAGVQVLPLNQAVMEILDSLSLSENRKKIPSFIELTLAIEEKLQPVFTSKFPTLHQYVDASSAEKSQRRILSISDELARLFARYGLYGEQFLPAWLSLEGWQQALWREIFSMDSPWTYPLAVLKGLKSGDFQGKVALFGFSHLSFAHLCFFSSISASIYQVSPCALFWGDHTSDKERLFVNRALQKKGVKENVQGELNRYMQQSHPLLGNWGKLGKEMLKSLDSFALMETEAYQEPEGESLLKTLKRSLLTLDETACLKADDSIQLHSATSKLREVEILRDALETLLQKQTDAGDPIMPREILVAGPDIASYAPYIQMVFSQSSFSYAIDGMPLASVSETVQGFLQLTELINERFALSSIAKLLSVAPFMQKSGLALDEVQKLCKWFKQAEVRQRLTGHPNSWEEGIDRLLFGLALIPDEESYFETWPIASIPQSEIDLFDRFLTLFAEIKRDLALFEERKSPSEWFEYFLQLADKYFLLEWEQETFFQELKVLAISCRSLKEKRWNFESIKRVIDHLAQKVAGEISSSKLQKIIFTSLKPGNLTSARILWCLGMDEGTFPRLQPRSSLCEMSKSKAADYFPSKSDEDRALFLELLVKAQDMLIFSYQRIHAEDGKHQEPSLLIEELNQYLIKYGARDGMMKLDHPAFPFDELYFSADARVKKWSQSDYLAARAHYFPHTESIPFFAPKSFAEKGDEQEIIIDIRQLKKVARNPLQFYFNETLKMYLKEEDDEEETEFLISYLRKSLLRKKALHTNLPQVMRRIKAEGKLPQGLFQDAAVQELEEEMEDLLKELGGFGIRPDEITAVNFSASCQEQEKNENLLPPLAIPLGGSKVAYIVGKLEDISPKGFLYHGDNDLKSLLKAWPLYLIYRCLEVENRPLLLTKKGVAVEFAISDPKTELASYLEYYLLAKQSPSPLMPEWAKALLEGNAEDLKTAMSKDTEDVYLNYLKRRQGLPDPIEALQTWSPQLRKTFVSLFSNH